MAKGESAAPGNRSAVVMEVSRRFANYGFMVHRFGSIKVDSAYEGQRSAHCRGDGVTMNSGHDVPL